MPPVPMMHANVNSHKNSRSKTIAMYFQSSITCFNSVENGDGHQEEEEEAPQMMKKKRKKHVLAFLIKVQSRMSSNLK